MKCTHHEITKMALEQNSILEKKVNSIEEEEYSRYTLFFNILLGQLLTSFIEKLPIELHESFNQNLKNCLDECVALRKAGEI
jgi:hypothetical protein